MASDPLWPAVGFERFDFPSTTEIARFDQELGNELAPFAAVLLRTESAASSNHQPPSLT